MMKKLTRSVLCAVLLLLLALPVAPGASAQLMIAPGGQILEITPVKQDFTVNKGSTVTREVSITNRNISPITLDVTFENIKAVGDEGGTAAAPDDVPWNLKQYTAVNASTFTLAAHATRKVAVTVTIPGNASPGGYYGRLLFTPVKRTDLPPVAIQGQIAELFLVRVPGPAKETGNIKDFQLNASDARKAGWLFLGTDGYWLTRVHNGGNVHFATAPKIEVKNQFGKTVLTKSATAQNVFPQADRKFEFPWSSISTGWYRATITTDLPGQVGAKKTISYLVVTPAVAIGAAVVLAVLLLWLLIRWRRNRRKEPLI